MRWKIRIINIIAIALTVFQILAYIGLLTEPLPQENGIDAIAFYIGFNIFLIIAAILFCIAYKLKKKWKSNNLGDMIDSIGKEE